MSVARLQRLVAPVVTPIDLIGAKEHLRLRTSDHDDLITGLIAAAVNYVDATGVLGRAMITQTWAQWTCARPVDVVLQMGNVQEITAVDYYDAAGDLQAASLSDFELVYQGERAVVRPVSGAHWPPAASRPDAIRVSFAAGYGDAAEDVPEGLIVALKMLVGHWFENREPVVTGTIVASLPLAFTSLIEAERLGWFG